MSEVNNSARWPRRNSDQSTKGSSRSSYGKKIQIEGKATVRHVGILGTFVIIVGSIANLATMAFLIFLWVGHGQWPGGREASWLWRQIMLHGWITQAITLSSVVMRISLALQASICTSFVAALILENYEVPLSKLAHFTVLRSVNGGPFTLVYLMSSIRALPRPGTVLLVLFLGILASQFTSTFLVSDLEFQSLVDFSHPTNISFMVSNDTQQHFIDQFAWGEAPAYVPFGEIPSGNDPTPNHLGVSDTGVLSRAWLPFKSNVSTLRTYSGPGWVLDSRVSCMPILLLDHQITINSRDIDASQFISGTLSYEAVFQQAELHSLAGCADDQCLPSKFNCSIPSSTDADRAPPVFLCVPSMGDSSLFDSTNSTIRESPISPSSIAMMVLVSNGNEADWNSSVGITASDVSSYEQNEWTIFQMQPSFTFNISLCFFTGTVDIVNIQLDIDTSPSEPSMQWDIETQALDTTEVRGFLGAEVKDETPVQRGLLNIEKISPLNLSAELSTLADMNVASLASLANGELVLGDDSGYFSGNQTFFMCYDALGFHNTFPSADYRMLFQDTITSTHRPALAVQSFLGLALQNFYYEEALWFDTFGEAQVASSITQRVPSRHTGLIIALVISATNLTCIIFITIWFLRRAKYTKHGNYWQAIAQAAATPDTWWILDQANELTDKEVSILLAGRDPKVNIGRSPKSGKVEIMKVGFSDSGGGATSATRPESLQKGFGDGYATMQGLQLQRSKSCH